MKVSQAYNKSKSWLQPCSGTVYEKVGISSIRKSREIGDFGLAVTEDQKG